MQIIKKRREGERISSIIVYMIDKYTWFALIVRIPLFIFSKKQYIDWDSENLYKGYSVLYFAFKFRIRRRDKSVFYRFYIYKDSIFKRELIYTRDYMIDNEIKLKGIVQI